MGTRQRFYNEKPAWATYVTLGVGKFETAQRFCRTVDEVGRCDRMTDDPVIFCYALLTLIV
ncbi:MAG: hypothetical protein AAFV90_04240 [Cyanobacteria bacterium J06634_5]